MPRLKHAAGRARDRRARRGTDAHRHRLRRSRARWNRRRAARARDRLPGARARRPARRLSMTTSVASADLRPSYLAAGSPRSACSCSTSSRSRRRRRCGTRASTSRPRTRSASRIRRAIRSSCCIGRVFAILPDRATVAHAHQHARRASAARSPAGMWFLITERVLVELVRRAVAAHRSAARSPRSSARRRSRCGTRAS